MDAHRHGASASVAPPLPILSNLTLSGRTWSDLLGIWELTLRNEEARAFDSTLMECERYFIGRIRKKKRARAR